MKTFVRMPRAASLALGLILAATAAPASATLTFDDWPVGTNVTGYGLIRDDTGALVTSASDPFYSHGVVSGNQALSSTGAGILNLQFLGPVDLQSLYVTSLNPQSSQVRIRGWGPTTSVDMVFSYNTTTPTRVTFGPEWSGITDLLITGIDGVGGADTDVTIDDLTYLPEPSTWATMLLGFAAIGLALRRKRPSAVLN